MSHRELGQKVLQRIIEDLRDVAVIEAAPRMEGRQMFMILAPNPKMLQAQRDRAKAQAAQAAQAASQAGAPAPAAPAAPAQEPQPAAVSPATASAAPNPPGSR
jgi:translation initiation factor IF-3